MRPQQISTILNQEFESVHHGHHTPVMLWGAPGIGKSQIIAACKTASNIRIFHEYDRMVSIEVRTTYQQNQNRRASK